MSIPVSMDPHNKLKSKKRPGILSSHVSTSFVLGFKKSKTYNSRDSLMVTHLTTNPPVSCLNRAERTGSLVLMILWSYVKEQEFAKQYIDKRRWEQRENGRQWGRINIKPKQKPELAKVSSGVEPLGKTSC
jgi:hypothetical protein